MSERSIYTFLLTTLPSNDLGLLTRSLPIAGELVSKGHKIVFSSPAKAPKKIIAEAGFENMTPKHPLYEIGFGDVKMKGIAKFLRSEYVKREYGGGFRFLFRLIRNLPFKRIHTTTDIWNLDHAMAMAGMMNKGFMKSQVEAYIRLIEECNADVVIDFFNPLACIASRVVKKPLVTVIQADAHPNAKGFIWWKEPPNNLPSALPTFNKVLRDFNLESISKVEDLSLGDLTLIVGTPETDPLEGDPEGIYIGPLLWQKEDSDLPDWFDELDSGKPVIWVYSGNPKYAPKRTVFDSGVIVDACVKVLSQLDAQVVLTTGHHPLPDSQPPLPKNFIHETYVPGLKMAERCDLMIHHGGYGSCQTGLFTGTPQLMIPTFSERESNARKVAKTGAGEFIIPVSDNEKRKTINLNHFREKVNRVLTDPRYKESAGFQSRKLAEYGGAGKAVELILEFTGNQDI